ncbi:MAG: O-antigen ligase family protein [Deltaproteobacteria bacterium]|nr:O-antigen ligase family protein [Deltaproteobacteria bacterium]
MNALFLALAVVLPALFWWTETDRLDLPKQACLLAVALAGLGWLILRAGKHRIDAISLSLAAALLGMLALAPAEAAARVEGWAGLMAALWVVLGARETEAERLRAWLARLALGLAGLAWLQAAGLPLFNAGIEGFEGRRVLGTLGGPGHLGWMLAGLLPWLGWGLWNRERCWRWSAGVGIVLGAVVLSGSRTAWVMTAVGLPFWLPVDRKRLLALGAVALVACSLAVGLDAHARHARLGDRIEDLSESQGTARGRLYVWQVHLSALTDLLVSPGAGPEGFQRSWPAWQAHFLATHPELEPFRSDLRHAHADAVELLCDLGPGGLALAIGILVIAVRRRRAGGHPFRDPVLGCLIVLLAGGLAAPLWSFAPTLALASLCLGLRLGPMRRPLFAYSGAVLLAALLAASACLGLRLGSEIVRAEASRARLAAQPVQARSLAERAAEIDARNPLAWIELAMDCAQLRDEGCLCQALQQAARDLPTDAVVEALARCERPARASR